MLILVLLARWFTTYSCKNNNNMANPSIYKIVSVKESENSYAKDAVSSDEQTEINNIISKFITHFKHQHL